MMELTQGEKRFIHLAVKDRLAEMNLERQKQASESAVNGELVSTLILEEELSVAESAWAKLKRAL